MSAAPAWAAPPRWGSRGSIDPIQSATGGGRAPARLGRQFEYSVKQQLERREWFVRRAPGSKTVVDILAIHVGLPALMIQCKRTGNIGSTEWNELYELAVRFGAVPVVCLRSTPRKTAFMRIDALREPRKPGRPWTQIDPETLLPVPVALTLPV